MNDLGRNELGLICVIEKLSWSTLAGKLEIKWYSQLERP